jgi:hypothetical protein
MTSGLVTVAPFTKTVPFAEVTCSESPSRVAGEVGEFIAIAAAASMRCGMIQ